MKPVDEAQRPREIFGPVAGHELSPYYRELLADLLRDGVSRHTQRAHQSDVRYLTAWRRVAVGGDLLFPEIESVVLQFILDHSVRKAAADGEEDAASLTALILSDVGLRAEPQKVPSPATVARRLATWRRLHTLRGVDGPFSTPGVRLALRSSRAAWTKAQTQEAETAAQTFRSRTAIDREALDRLVAATGSGLHGLRDRAILEVAWASGGRRAEEICSLEVGDLDQQDYERTGVIFIQLRRSKTHQAKAPPRLFVDGVSAAALRFWMSAAGISQGPVFRALAAGRKNGDALVRDRGLSTRGLHDLVRRLCVRAGLGDRFASPHGLRSGFITEAVRNGVPVEDVMQMTLHRSRSQIRTYYRDGDILSNRARGLRSRSQDG